MPGFSIDSDALIGAVDLAHSAGTSVEVSALSAWMHLVVCKSGQYRQQGRSSYLMQRMPGLSMAVFIIFTRTVLGCGFIITVEACFYGLFSVYLW